MKNIKCKLFSFLVSLCMMLSLLPSVNGIVKAATVYPVTDVNSLKDALNNVQDGDTVQLEKDITVSEVPVQINKSISLNLNGKTLSNGRQWSVFPSKLIEIANGSDVTICGRGTIKNEVVGDSAILVGTAGATSNNYASLTIDDLVTIDGNTGGPGMGINTANYAKVYLRGNCSVSAYTAISGGLNAEINIEQATVNALSYSEEVQNSDPSESDSPDIKKYEGKALSTANQAILNISGDQSFINGSWNSSWGNSSKITGGYFTVIDGLHFNKTSLIPADYTVEEVTNEVNTVKYTKHVISLEEEQKKLFAGYVEVNGEKIYSNNLKELHTAYLDEKIYIQNNTTITYDENDIEDEDGKSNYAGYGQTAAVSSIDEVSNAFSFDFHILDGATLTFNVPKALVMSVHITTTGTGNAIVTLTPADNTKYSLVKNGEDGTYFINRKDDQTIVAKAIGQYGSKDLTREVLNSVLTNLTGNTTIKDPETIILQENVSFNESVILGKKDLTIDLNGYSYTYNKTNDDSKLNAAFISQLGGTITLENSASNTRATNAVLNVENAPTSIALGSSQSSDRFGNGVIKKGVTVKQTVAIFNQSTLKVAGSIETQSTPAISGNGGKGELDGKSLGGTTVIIQPDAQITSDQSAAIYQPQNGKLIVEGGSISGKAGIVARAGSVVIKGGTVTATGDNKISLTGKEVPCAAVVVDKEDAYNSDSLNVVIEDGNFVATNQENQNNNVLVIENGEVKEQKEDVKGIIAVKGGIFDKSIPNSYIATGYKLDSEMGDKKVLKDEGYTVDHAVARNITKDGIDFETVEEAISEAAIGNTIVLLDNVSLENTINIKKDLALSLNGKTLTKNNTGAAFKVTSGELILKDVSVEELQALDADLGTITNSAESQESLIVVQGNTAKLTIESGCYKEMAAQTAGIINISEGAEGKISGGSIYGTLKQDDEKNQPAITVKDRGSKLTVENSAVIESNEVGIGVFGAAELVVSGERIEADSFAIASNGLTENSDSKIDISGGEIISKNDVAMYLPAINGNTTIHGTTVIKGLTGIEIRAGFLTVKNDLPSDTSKPEISVINKVENESTPLKIVENGSGSTTTGAGIAVSQHISDENINVQILGGNISGTAALSVANPENKEDTQDNVTVNVASEAELTGTISIDSSYKKTYSNNSQITINGSINDPNLNNIKEAKLHDTDSSNPEESPYESGTYSFSTTPYWKTDNGPYIYVPVKVSGLKKHRNSQGNEGYWIGISIPVPDEATSCKVSASAQLDSLGSSTPSYDNVTGQIEESIYINALPENGSPNRWILVEWTSSESQECGTQLYNLNLDEVTLVRDASRILDVQVAPLSDESRLFKSPNSDNQFATIYDEGTFTVSIDNKPVGVKGQYISLKAQNLKPILMADKLKEESKAEIGYWFGVMIKAPEDKYTKYSINDSKILSTDQLYASFYTREIPANWCTVSSIKKEYPFVINWYEDNAESSKPGKIENFVLDVDITVYQPDVIISGFDFKANKELADKGRGNTTDSIHDTMWVTYEQDSNTLNDKRLKTPGYWAVLSDEAGHQWIIDAIKPSSFENLPNGIKHDAFSFYDQLKDKEITLREGTYYASLYFLPDNIISELDQDSLPKDSEINLIDREEIKLQKLTFASNVTGLVPEDGKQLEKDYGITFGNNEYSLFATTEDTEPDDLGISDLRPVGIPTDSFVDWKIENNLITPRVKYGITVIKNPEEGGKVTLKESTSAPTEGISGDPITIKVTPNSGYYVKSVEIKETGGSAVQHQANSNGEYTFTMPDSDVNISVKFEKFKGSFNLSLQKTLLGRDWNSDDSFKFIIAPDSNTLQAINSKILNIDKTLTGDHYELVIKGSNSSTGDTKSESFGTFTIEGQSENDRSYGFTISEVLSPEQQKTIVCTNSSVKLTVKATKAKKDGKFTGGFTYTCEVDPSEAVAPSNNSGVPNYTVSFENTVIASDIDNLGKLEVKKNLEGRDWQAGESYQAQISLASSTNASNVLISNGENGKYQNFSSLPPHTFTASTEGSKDPDPWTLNLKFKTTGEYIFEISEVIPPKAQQKQNIKYDETKYQVKYQVVNDTDGFRVSSRTINDKQSDDGLITIKNSYELENASWIPSLSKILNGRNWSQINGFTYTLALDEDSPKKTGYSMAENPNQITIDGEHTKENFAAITFSQPGTYVFTVKEKALSNTNARAADDSAESDIYTFTVEVHPDKTENGLELEFEPNSIKPGMTQTEGGKQYTTNTIFESSFTGNGIFPLDVQKTLNGKRDWEDADSFNFTLVPQEAYEGVTYPDKQNHSSTSPYSFSITNKDTKVEKNIYLKKLGNIEFTNPGLYHFNVEEKYDDSKMTNEEPNLALSVRVHDNKDVETSFAHSGTDSVETASANDTALPFVNIASAEPEQNIPASTATFTLKKSYTNKSDNKERAWSDGQFKIRLTMTEGEASVTSNGIKLSKNGSQTIDLNYKGTSLNIVFSQEGEYAFTVSEVNNRLANVDYDESQYQISTTVAKELNAYVPKVLKVTKGSVTVSKDDIIFANVYTGGSGSSTTTDPTDPSNPSGSTDPTNPSNPSDPSNPTDPSDPTNPTDPSGSGSTNPTNPSDPSNPSNPNTPSNTTTDAYGDLVITKSVVGTGADTNRSWDFTLVVSNINGTYSGVTFTNGNASFSLKHGESITIQRLPAGVAYRVTEVSAGTDGYRMTSQGASGTIQEGVVSRADFINTYNPSGSNLNTSTGTGSNSSSTSTSSGTSNNLNAANKSANTGDNSHFSFWMSCLVLSLIGLAGVALAFRKASRKEN